MHFHVSRNVCCYYISSYIMTNKYCYYISSRIRRCIMTNKYCYYTSSYIRRYARRCIKKCLLSLYIFLYNEKYIFMYQEMFVVIIYLLI